MRIALYEPDQAGNVGTILRTAACLGVAVDLIEPCGFAFSHRALKRAGMDYAGLADVTRHADWAAFEARLGERPGARLVLFTTAPGALPLPQARLEAADTLLFGSESRGVPQEVHGRAELRVRIPQVAGTRSLNLAVAAGIGLAEGMRQAGLWPAAAGPGTGG
jgi:tRNA (cytidine/uridine-2'-O-)-methyltransferase